MRRKGDYIGLELPDLIRMNRLVRGGTDQEGFADWFGELDDLERRALIMRLLAYACQAGVDEDVHQHALLDAGMASDDAWVENLTRRFLEQGEKDPHLRSVQDDIGSAESSELGRYLKWSAALFGVAEGRIFRSETAEYCSHWWHRDLKDERVVRDLLSRSNFSATSMKDDRRIQGPWWRWLF